ncbi:MAG: HNH endonuclease [Alcanivoracaceae bacterium]|nr:HNH endonuclease [Alcanivoracaceae bacterium]
MEEEKPGIAGSWYGEPMNYWWVNHKQTFRQERQGGYLWSPKRRADGARQQSYEWMRIVKPGDVIFAFADGRVNALGVAQSSGYDCPKPEEFGSTGAYWDKSGWRVDVAFYENFSSIRPADHIAQLTSYLPEKYSPIHPSTGHGQQGIYLGKISRDLAVQIARLTDRWVLDLVQGNYVLDVTPLSDTWRGQADWERYLQDKIANDDAIPETERRALLKARIGQGQFRKALFAKSQGGACLITGVSKPEHLVASHIKPWRNGSNDERLDPENGFLLTPSIDHLFDKGFISFENDGRIIPSEAAEIDTLTKMGIPMAERAFRARMFSEGERRYLDYHRENILLAVR